MINQRECIIVDEIDYGQLGNQYPKEYRGKYVYDKRTDALVYFSKDGKYFSIMDGLPRGYEEWSPREVFDALANKEQTEEQTKKQTDLSERRYSQSGLPVRCTQTGKISILELLVLGDKFNTDDIIKLKNAGLL